jgi:GAF domain-containing protein
MIVEDPARFAFVSPVLRQRNLSSLTGIPLVVRGQVTGVLYAGLFSQASFTSWHIRLLELVADRVALALAQSRLLESERRAREEAELIRERVTRLHSITAALAATMTPQEVVEVVLEVGKEALGANSAVIATLTDEGEFEMVGGRGYTEAQVAAWRTLPAGTARPAADVVRTGEPSSSATGQRSRRSTRSSRRTCPRSTCRARACRLRRAGE